MIIGAARHADPPLSGRRRRSGDDVQPDRLDDAQQPGDERGDPPGGAALPVWPRGDRGLLNHIEVAIRAYDPCLSCATHALGKMPLTVELRDPTVRWYSLSRIERPAVRRARLRQPQPWRRCLGPLLLARLRCGWTKKGWLTRSS